MNKFNKWNVSGKTLQDYALLYYYEQAGRPMTVAEDGGIYLGKCRIANSCPANSTKEETHVIKQCKESL